MSNNVDSQRFTAAEESVIRAFVEEYGNQIRHYTALKEQALSENERGSPDELAARGALGTIWNELFSRMKAIRSTNPARAFKGGK